MKIFRLSNKSEGIDEAAALLRAGALVAFGTETVYGLGADATNPRAVAAVFAAKDRPRFNPLICHLFDAEAAWRHVDPGPHGARLAALFWPGPLTLVLPRRAESPVCPLAAAGLPSLAVRVPAPAPCRALLRAAGVPVAAPSANPSGRISPTTAAHVLAGLGDRVAAVLDTGPCAVGVESTVLDLCGPPVLLRPGGIALEAIEATIGPVARDAAPPGAMPRAPPRAPGGLASHYAPWLPLRTDADDVAADEALLAFGVALPGPAAVFELSRTNCLAEAAARLFEGLHELDETGRRLGLRGIACMKVPEAGLGRAINDRLRRAAAPRNQGVAPGL